MKYRVGVVEGAKAYWVNTRWACGGVEVVNNIIVGGAPIFKKLVGENIQKIARIYHVVRV